jgi:FkbM family methyltransferase
MASLESFRKRLARSSLGAFIRRLGLHKGPNAVYEAMLRSKNAHTIRFAGAPVKFRVTNRREASRLDNFWEMGEIEELARSMKPGDVFYDLGANIGHYAVCIGAFHKDQVEVHAFEPEPGNAARLRENAALNGLSRVTVHEAAVSNENGTARFFVSGTVGTPTHSLVESHFGDADGRHAIDVPLVRLTDYSAKHNLAKPTVIKIDVEGAEAEVVESIQDWMNDPSLRRIEIEYHSDTLKERGQSADDIERSILSHGYTRLTAIEREGGTRPVLVAYERTA